MKKPQMMNGSAAWMMAAHDVGGAAIAAPSGVLEVQTATPEASVDLSREGTLDWVHWGLIEGDNIVHRKDIVAPLISPLQKIGAREFHTFVSDASYSWSDGQPIQNASDVRRGLFIYAVPNGMELSIVADQTVREVKLYGSLWFMQARLDVSLSDDSAQSVALTEESNIQAGKHLVFTIRYRASKPGQTLDLRWMNDKGSGNVTLQAVTLRQAEAR